MVNPFKWRFYGLYMGVTNYLLSGMILQVGVWVTSSHGKLQILWSPPKMRRKLQEDDHSIQEILILGGGNSKIFYFHGKWSNLTNIFQIGWNHQPVVLLVNHHILGRKKQIPAESSVKLNMKSFMTTSRASDWNPQKGGWLVERRAFILPNQWLEKIFVFLHYPPGFSNIISHLKQNDKNHGFKSSLFGEKSC